MVQSKQNLTIKASNKKLQAHLPPKASDRGPLPPSSDIVTTFTFFKILWLPLVRKNQVIQQKYDIAEPSIPLNKKNSFYKTHPPWLLPSNVNIT